MFGINKSMSMENSTLKIEEFMDSPIVAWIKICLDNRMKIEFSYDDLVDGVLIYDVFLQMNIDGQSNDVSPSNNDPIKRLANLKTLMRRIRQFYENLVGDLILFEPELRRLAYEPRSNVSEIELLLILLLGCAVKCNNKKYFVERLNTLDEFKQQELADYIKKLTNLPDILLNKNMLYNSSTDEAKVLRHKKKVQRAFKAIRQINAERKELLERQDSNSLVYKSVHNFEKQFNECQADVIALSEQLEDYKRKLDVVEKEKKKLASKVKSYRDSFEDASEKSQQIEKLEQEVASYKSQLQSIKDNKDHINRLEEFNRLLNESNNELHDQLNAEKLHFKKAKKEMEADIYRLQQQCHDLAMEIEASNKQNFKLYEKNMELERQIDLTKSKNVTLDISFEEDELIYNISIGEQLAQSPQSLKLELENSQFRPLGEKSLSVLSFDFDKEKNRLQFKDNDSKETDEMVIQKLQGQRESEDDSEASGVGLDESRLTSSLMHKVEYDQLDNDHQSSMQESNSFEQQLRDLEVKFEAIGKKSQGSIEQECIDLKLDFSALMAEYHKAKAFKVTKLQNYDEEKLYSVNAKISELEEQNSDLQEKVELLTEINERMEKDNDMFMKYVHQIMQQNQKLVKQSLEDKNQFFEEERKKNETLNNLNRAKAKLEEKIMDQYKRMENARDTKKRSTAITAMKNTFTKMCRASTELFGRRQSYSFDKRESCSKTSDISSRPNESGYIPKPRNRKSVDFLENFSVDDFSFDEKRDSAM